MLSVQKNEKITRTISTKIKFYRILFNFFLLRRILNFSHMGRARGVGRGQYGFLFSGSNTHFDIFTNRNGLSVTVQ